MSLLKEGDVFVDFIYIATKAGEFGDEQCPYVVGEAIFKAFGEDRALRVFL